MGVGLGVRGADAQAAHGTAGRGGLLLTQATGSSADGMQVPGAPVASGLLAARLHPSAFNLLPRCVHKRKAPASAPHSIVAWRRFGATMHALTPAQG